MIDLQEGVTFLVQEEECCIPTHPSPTLFSACEHPAKRMLLAGIIEIVAWASVRILSVENWGTHDLSRGLVYYSGDCHLLYCFEAIYYVFNLATVPRLFHSGVRFYRSHCPRSLKHARSARSSSYAVRDEQESKLGSEPNRIILPLVLSNAARSFRRVIGLIRAEGPKKGQGGSTLNLPRTTSSRDLFAFLIRPAGAICRS